ncbi:MAG: hypothetical protein ABIG73_00135 [Patescibacteria group bacterium]
MRIIYLMADITNNLRLSVINLGGSEWVVNLKILGIFLTLVFGVLVIILINKVDTLKKFFKATSNFLKGGKTPKKNLNASWQKVVSRLNKNDEANLHMALIEADKIFDDLLKLMGLPGESMADRLKYLNSAQVSNIEEIWQAHKLRNQLVHGSEYTIARSEIEFGVRAYEKALKELEFID